MNDEEDIEGESIEGRVIEALPSTHFRIKTKTGQVILAFLGGRMRVHKIKVLVGDKVTVYVDPSGGKGRIIKRL